MKTNQFLSEQEFALIEDITIIHQKAAALSKIKHNLSNLAQALNENCIQNASFAELALEFSPAKISRGENYLGLPYLVLDYPASYSKSSIFAFRTLFWWGNFFSFTLHLQGEILEKIRPNILKHQELIQKNDFYVCVNESPWQYHYENSNYKKASSFEPNELLELLQNKAFIKLSYKINLENYKSLNQTGLSVFQTFKGIIA